MTLAAAAAIAAAVVLAAVAPALAAPTAPFADRETCTPVGERCAGAPGQAFVQWSSCCGRALQVDCLPHPDADTDGTRWGRFCQDTAAPRTTDMPATTAPPVAASDSAHSPAPAALPAAGGPTAAEAPSKDVKREEGATYAADGRPGLATYRVTQKSTLIPTRYTADASAHVVDGRVVVWASHDLPVTTTAEDETQYMMRDYALFSFSEDMAEVTDHGNVLPIDTVPWVKQMMWAPDAVCRDGMCYLYFPAQDADGIFRIGVATSRSVYGPYTAEPEPIEGSYSIDPAVFVDDDGEAYLYFGGDWGGQLQRWTGGKYDASAQRPTSGPSLKARVARLSKDMRSFVGGVREMTVVDEAGEELEAMDQGRRFFEGSWVHKVGDLYYFSYSTGETHKIVYATGKGPTGPWTYRGEVLSPPTGWTNHHSIAKATDGKWYLFYHDSQASGKTPLRNVKMQELKYDGTQIVPMSP